MIIDTHCHYNLDPIFPNWKKFQAESVKQGVVGAVIPGVDETTSKKGAALAAISPYFRFAIGIHPVTAGERHQQIDITILEELYDQVNQVAPPIAVGETGLDFFHLPTAEKSREIHISHQKLAFLAHIELANAHRLPLIIHVRDRKEAMDNPNSAYWQTLSLMEQSQPTVPYILHCVSGPFKYIAQAVRMGAYVSYAGNCTYPSAQSIRDSIPLIPGDKILIETDAPYLPPQAHRGDTCRPSFIRETAEYVAGLGIAQTQLIENAQTLFNTSFI